MPGPSDERRREAAEARWREAGYSRAVMDALVPDIAYSVVHIDGIQFAFSDYDGFVAALKAAWRAGFTPDHGPGSVLGADLPEVAPSLEAVNSVEYVETWLRERDPG